MHRFLLTAFISAILSLTFHVAAIEPDEFRVKADTVPAAKIVQPGANTTLVDSIISFGKKYLNYRYRSGSNNESRGGFDCSGFTSFVYSKFGYQLTHSSAAQAKQFPNVKKKEIRPGDLVFYAGRRGRSGIGHVGYVTEVHDNGTFSFIHATNGAGVTISKSTEPYYVRRYRTAARVVGYDSLMLQAPEQLSLAEVILPTDSAQICGQTIATPVVKQEAPKKTASPGYHTVRKGDSLSSLSQRYGISVKQLKKLNGLKGDMIKIKQKLRIR